MIIQLSADKVPMQLLAKKVMIGVAKFIGLLTCQISLNHLVLNHISFCLVESRGVLYFEEIPGKKQQLKIVNCNFEKILLLRSIFVKSKTMV